MKTYTVQLTDVQIELIEKALTAYEAQAHQSELMGTIFGAIFSDKTDEGRAKYKRESEESFKRAEAEANSRRRSCVMIRARFAEVMSRGEEFTTDLARR